MSEGHAKKSHGGGHGGGGGGHEEGGEGGCPEWMISFADNTALIMGFFVILLALMMAEPKGTNASAESNNATPEQLDWALDVRAGFNNPVNINSEDPRDQLLVQRLVQRERERVKLENDKKAPLKKDEKDGQKLMTLSPTDFRALASAVLFEKDAAVLSEESVAALATFAEKVRGLRLMIEVRGHASDVEVRDQKDRGAALCFNRALAVANILTQNGLYWEQMRLITGGRINAAGLPGYNENKRAYDQRVELHVTSEPMEQDLQSRGAAGKPVVGPPSSPTENQSPPTAPPQAP